MGEKKSFYIVKLDFYKSRRTGAKTEWKIFTDDGEWLTLEEAEARGWIRKLYSTANNEKIRWFEYWDMTGGPYFSLVKIHTSSKGKVSKYLYHVWEL